jgi:hypothetical protein
MIPVNMRGGRTGPSATGSRCWSRGCPLDERSPRERLARVVAETRALKHSHQAAGMEAIEELGDATFTSLFVEFARATASRGRSTSS